MARSEAVRSGGRTILGAGANGCAASCALRLLQLAEHLFRPREIKGWQMDDVAVARALHVLSIVLWIGGVGFVTTDRIAAERSPPQSATRTDRIL